MKKNYLDFLPDVTRVDVEVLLEKEKSYKGSCFKRGGTGFYMMLARKWDRLEAAVEAQNYDLFKAIEVDSRPEGLLDDIQDLRRYLALGEAYLLARKYKEAPQTTTTTSIVHTSREELEKRSSYTKSATPGGIRKVPRNPVETIPKSVYKSTEMESPFGYAPTLDDLPE